MLRSRAQCRGVIWNASMNSSSVWLDRAVPSSAARTVRAPALSRSTSATAVVSISPDPASGACLAQIDRGSPARTNSMRRYAAAWAPRSSFTGLRLAPGRTLSAAAPRFRRAESAR
jgi:hypothetical protein